MNQTTNYQLSQWESTDRILMSDFNSDNSKIDAALKANADAIAAEAAARTAALAAKGNCKIEFKTYTGNGGSGSGSPTQITFSGQPTAVLLSGYDGIAAARYGDTLVTSAYSTSSGSGISSINAAWSGSTLSFFANTAAGQLNVNGRTYWALAFYLLDEA